MPKNSPMAADTPNATKMLNGVTSVVTAELVPNDCPLASRAASTPDEHADRAADDRHEQGFDDELEEDVLPLGADRLADADLARPFRHRHEHDVHRPDAADDQRDAGDGAQEDRQRLAHAASPWP